MRTSRVTWLNFKSPLESSLKNSCERIVFSVDSTFASQHLHRISRNANCQQNSSVVLETFLTTSSWNCFVKWNFHRQKTEFRLSFTSINLFWTLSRHHLGSKHKIPSECGVSGDHVLRLCESLPTGIPFKIFADNYFVSLPLVTKLKEKGFHFTGTFRQNRIPINFESDKTLKFQGRGSSDYY